MKNTIRIYGLNLILLCVTLIQTGCFGVVGSRMCGEDEDTEMVDMPIYEQIPVRINNTSEDTVHIWVTGAPFFVDGSETMGPKNKLVPGSSRYFEFGRRFEDEVDEQAFTVNLGQNGKKLKSITTMWNWKKHASNNYQGWEVYYVGRLEGEFFVEFYPSKFFGKK